MSHSVFSITPTDVEKSLDKATLQVRPKSLEQFVCDTIDFLTTPSSVLGDQQVEVLKNNQTTIGGLPAREVTYLTHSIGTFNMQAFVIKDDRLYTFVFSTQELQVPQTFPAVQKMLQSVKFLTPKTNASNTTNTSSLTPTTTATTAEDKNYIEFSKNAITCKLSEAQGLPIKEACDKFNNP